MYTDSAPLTPLPSCPPSPVISPSPIDLPTPPPSYPPSRVASPSCSNKGKLSTTTTPALSAPRILCLHGGGTNAHIFRVQCRILIRGISPSFRLVFAQAPYSAQPGSDVTSVYKQCKPFRGWLQSGYGAKRSSTEVVEDIVECLNHAMSDDDACGATGEWVAILGFSQGAKVTASILLTQQILRRHHLHSCPEPIQRRPAPVVLSLPQFHFGILVAGRGPLVWLAPETDISSPIGMAKASRPSLMGVTDEEAFLGDSIVSEQLGTPTLHVHGLKDPGLNLHRMMLERWCVRHADSDAIGGARLLEWDGEHRIAIKRRDVESIVEAICKMPMEVRR